MTIDNDELLRRTLRDIKTLADDNQRDKVRLRVYDTLAAFTAAFTFTAVAMGITFLLY